MNDGGPEAGTFLSSHGGRACLLTQRPSRLRMTPSSQVTLAHTPSGPLCMKFAHGLSAHSPYSVTSSLLEHFGLWQSLVGILPPRRRPHRDNRSDGGAIALFLNTLVIYFGQSLQAKVPAISAGHCLHSD